MRDIDFMLAAQRIPIPRADWKPRIRAHAERARLYLLAAQAGPNDLVGEALQREAENMACHHAGRALHLIAVRQGDAWDFPA